MARARFDLVPLSRHDESMHASIRARHLAPATLSIALLVAGCSDDSNVRRPDVVDTTSDVSSTTSGADTTGAVAPATTEPRTDDEAVAFGLCTALRDQANVMT